MTGIDRTITALRVADRGAAVALDWFRSPLDIESKADPTDYVTDADRAVQRVIESVIMDAFPGEPIIGEETADSSVPPVPTTGPVWIVDPIDGTKNFIRGIPVWCVSLSTVVDGTPRASVTTVPPVGDTYLAGIDGRVPTRNGDPIAVSDVADPDLATVAPIMWWTATTRGGPLALVRSLMRRFDDIRRFGSAQLTLAQVAAGGIDGLATDLTLAPWDSVAGVHLIRAAGGTVTDIHGDRWQPRADGLVASNGQLHDELIAAVTDTHDG